MHHAIADLQASSVPERTAPPHPSAPTSVSGPSPSRGCRIVAYPKPISYFTIDLPNRLDTIFQDRDSLIRRKRALRRWLADPDTIIVVKITGVAEIAVYVPGVPDTLVVTAPYWFCTA